MKFDIAHQTADGRARTGRLMLEHGAVRTPAYMPCASRAALRACPPDEVAAVGVQILVANAYHLHLRPGEEVVATCGGLHRFMGWDRPILTDSGGFQVFSLADSNDIAEEGVTFKSPVDGRDILLTPELSAEIQMALGSDIAMPLDECCPCPADREYVERSLERTLRWAERSLSAHDHPWQQLFGIVQGGIYPDLRERSARETASLGFPGFGIGGLSVGEDREDMLASLEAAQTGLPRDRPVHLMGVGTPLDIVDCAAAGVDLFDCVLPTRNARHGSIMTWEGPVRIKGADYETDTRPLSEQCDCPACAGGFERAYLRHLHRTKEALGWQLLSLHNVRFYTQLMERVREAIEADALDDLRGEVSAWSERDRT
ncbi:MAG: tRNA guanosine(34) transglycosylase Tgt [Armatimonadia bacterium]|nr:tRNA guanosine(34) transglycosylase Tgt [Armatimonadia bacterium]